MNTPVPLFRSGLLCLALVVFSHRELRGQTVTEPPVAKPAATADALSQAELLKSYLRVREQLHDAELAITNNRLESEAAARAQAAAIGEKLDSIKSVIATEREQQRAEADRNATEQERQRVAARETNRIVIGVAVAFGVVGLITMLATTFLQWRGIRRMAEVTALQQQLPSVLPQNLIAAGQRPLPGETVSLSNQRLMSVIDRMERRILELEHTTVQPPAGTSALEPIVEPAATRSVPPGAMDQAARISALLGKGRALLNASNPGEALECYDEILALDANHPEALVKKGSALERLKRDLEAIECYDRAIRADQNMALAYLSKGGVFNRLQRFDEAIECYERALQVEKAGKQTTVARVSVSGDWTTGGSSVPV